MLFFYNGLGEIAPVHAAINASGMGKLSAEGGIGPPSAVFPHDGFWHERIYEVKG